MTRLLADENISPKTIQILKQQDIDIIGVRDTKPGATDKEVVKIANREKRVIITFDKDFGEIIVRNGLKAPGLILLRINKTPEEVAKRILDLVKRRIPLEGKIVVVQEKKVRLLPIR
ncbi:MAG: DUF5615 family PIN-like protein [Candidatus Bathyarchaeota archaeon]|nr:DUF5615 family PIN-like protein [Candidatus Bathyarchaeota archaeon]